MCLLKGLAGHLEIQRNILSLVPSVTYHITGERKLYTLRIIKGQVVCCAMRVGESSRWVSSVESGALRRSILEKAVFLLGLWRMRKFCLWLHVFKALYFHNITPSAASASGDVLEGSRQPVACPFLRDRTATHNSSDSLVFNCHGLLDQSRWVWGKFKIISFKD